MARHLVMAGHEVHIVSAAPEFVFKRDIASPKLHIRRVSVFGCISLICFASI